MKKIIGIAIVSLFAFALFAGGSNEAAASTSATGGTTEKSLVIALTSDCAGLSPYGINRGGKQFIRTLLYEPLFWIDEAKNMCPIVGKSYEAIGNGIFEVTIFDNVYDSAGNHLTASDVVYSIKQLIDEGHGSSFVGSLSAYEAVDEYKVRLTFSNNTVGNFETLVTNLYVITQAAWDASPDAMAADPVGTGRYAYVGGVSGSEYVFEKRDNYWQTDSSYIVAKNSAIADKLTLKVIKDVTTIAVALENGEIDYSMNIEGEDFFNFLNQDYTAKKGYVSKELVNASLIRLMFNCSDLSACADINLRKAIATCVDNAAIAFNAEKALGHASVNFYNPGWLDIDENVSKIDNYYNYDVDAAKAYLAASGYKGETLRLLVQPNQNCTSAAVLIQAYCKAIGINVELLQYESAMYSEYFDDETGDKWDFVVWGINSTVSYAWKALYELDVNQHTTDTCYLQINDPKLQELYEVSSNAATNTTAATNELIKYVTDNCYEYALFHYNVCYVGGSKIKSIVIGGGNAESIYNAFEFN